MTWSSTVFHRNRRLLNYGLAIILLLLVTISAEGVRLFAGNLSATLFYSPFFKLRSNIESLQNVAEENRLLKNQLAQASLMISNLTEARRENQRLRDFIGFEPPPSFRLIPAKIFSLMQHFYPIAAVINKGSEDGITINLPVVNRYGLVGKIKEVMSHTATVQLLTDPGNAVSGRVAESRQIGVVKFSPEQGMMFDNLPGDAEIKKGDLIISSGLGGIYPAGLAVAVVDSVYPNVGDILKAVRLKPTVDFSEIDELYVLVR
jgi:rod shape-determining protein MreC